ncbi:protein transport protein Sec24A-like isoform X2 [Argiope bruennichi]|uniref:protein transport protein Sec24A-like isoform X2 n=1 Tax=Argiope bruennichi TaxID=94029 RepID=UPI0024956F39|nr:protein transport protein Sec24A-like isoform X2 [Argiope bruennichi]
MSQNPNLSQPFMYQNAYSPNNGQPPTSLNPNPMNGPPSQNTQKFSPGNLGVSPARIPQPIPPQGMSPYTAQNYYASNYSRPPSSTEPPMKPLQNLVPPPGGTNLSQSASPKNLASPFPVEKQNSPYQNGPFSPFNNSNSEQNLNGADPSQVNGIGATNRLMQPNQNMPPLSPWAQPPRMPLTPGQPNQKLSGEGMPPPPTSVPPQSLAVDGKAVPTLSQVPSSSGLPMPFGNQATNSSSPQVTPGTSQPPSARSSRNPSPIASQRYDYMEGQFSNKPSPSNSSLNLPSIGASSNSGMPPPNQRNLSDSRQFTSPQASNLYPPNMPYPPNSTPGSLQPGPPPVGSQSTPVRPRYPQQVGYNQSASPYASLGQPNNMQPPPVSGYNSSPQLPPTSAFNSSPHLPPTSAYNSSPQPPPAPTCNSSQPPYSQQQQPPGPLYQGGLPEGPVGGVAGYDPQLHAKMAGLSVHSSFSRLWGNDSLNLLQDRNILPPVPIEAPKPVLTPERPNCSPDVFRCTLTKVPDTNSLLQKSRLPFGILIHPFRDAASLSVIQCNTIVRCRNCRTYINPFVTFVDQRRWKCNLCFRVNDLPEEFLYDPATRSYGDPARRPEIKNATIEFIAPSDYMLRPPQPAVYLFLLDVSHGAIETGYLENFCKVMLENLDELPGDSRMRIGFITYDGSIHFYNLGEGLNQPHMLVVSDIEDVFLPSPDNLLVNVHESKSLISDLLTDLPKRFASNGDINCCLGAALQAAYKLMSPVGGRVTVVLTTLPNYGPGALKNREDPNQRAGKDISNIGPANDFYKKLALDCSGQQIAVDLFLLCSQYVDIATVSCISKYSSGGVHYYPGYHRTVGRLQVNKFAGDLKRYLTRRIGFEAVMRVRCTRGLAIHTFHGNFFVRSTDLLSLPNVNPDTGYGMQIAIEENLTEYNSVCFQAAVLYTSSNGERRIRVHTLCLPVVSIVTDVLGGADQETIIGLVSKMAVDRSVTSSLSDARDALINVCVDVLGVYKATMSGQVAGALMSPYSLRLLPLFILALLKHMAFRTGVSTKLDERVYAMERMKALPLQYLMKFIYPTLYPVHALDDKNAIHQDDDVVIPQPSILQLSSEKIDRHGAYILDTLDVLYLYIGRAINDQFCTSVFNVPNFSAIPEDLESLPELATPESERLRTFVTWLQDQRPYHSPLKIIREDSRDRHIFMQYMLDDRTESLFSYYEFLQHIRQQISK